MKGSIFAPMGHLPKKATAFEAFTLEIKNLRKSAGAEEQGRSAAEENGRTSISEKASNLVRYLLKTFRLQISNGQINEDIVPIFLLPASNVNRVRTLRERFNFSNSQIDP